MGTGLLFGTSFFFCDWDDSTELTIGRFRLFLIAIGSTIAMGCQNYFFGVAAANLTSRLRSLSFKAILRQDSELIK